jgi:hypothetical protein
VTDELLLKLFLSLRHTNASAVERFCEEPCMIRAHSSDNAAAGDCDNLVVSPGNAGPGIRQLVAL